MREALLRLYGEKLIVANPGRGFYVKPLNVKELAGIHNLNFMILRNALETTYSAFSMNGLQIPDAIVQARRRAEESSRLRPEDIGFIEKLFERIALLSGNPAALETVQNGNDRTRFARILDLENEEVAVRIATDVRDLIGHLTRGSRKAAIMSLECQLKRQLTRLPELVRKAYFRAHGVDDSAEEIYRSAKLRTFVAAGTSASG